MAAGTTTPEAAVGAGFRTLDIWPALTPEQRVAVEPELMEKMGSIATGEVGVSEHGFHELKDGEVQHSAFHIPMSVINEESGRGPNLIDYAGIVTAGLGRKELRFGARFTSHTSGYFIGLSEKPSPREAQVLCENSLWQFSRGEAVDSIAFNEVDGSLTLQYPGDQFPRTSDRVERVRMLHAHVLENVAPQLENGVVVAPILVEMQGKGYPTLFTAPAE